MPRSKLPLLAMTIALAVAACSSPENTQVTTTTTSKTSPSTITDPGTTTVPDATTTTIDQSSTSTTAPARNVGSELAFNPDFDLGDVTPTGWEFVVEGSDHSVEYVAESGGHHVSFFAPVSADAPWPIVRQVQEFTVTPHTDYLISVEARSVTEGRLYIAIGFRDEGGNKILERGPGEPGVSESDWTTIEGVVESPHEAATGYVILGLAIRPELTQADSLFLDVNRVSVKELLG